MSEELIAILENGSTSDVGIALKKFVVDNSSTTSFPHLNENGLRERTWKGIFRLLNDSRSTDVEKETSLSALKILIRDKTQLETLATEDRLVRLTELAHLSPKSVQTSTEDERETIVESVKCLYNLILNANPIAKRLHDLNTIEPLIRRAALRGKSLCNEGNPFDLKLLFLMTAFCPTTRLQIFRHVGGLPYFDETLSVQLDIVKNPKITSAVKGQQITSLGDELKILFNILSEIKGENSNICRREDWDSLVAVLREYLNENKEAQFLTSDVINLFTLIPINSLSAITTKNHRSRKNDTAVEIAGLSAITKIMDYLENILPREQAKTDNTSLEILPPVLLALLHLAKSCSVIRKHIRQRILPKLTEKEVFTRPEEGNTLRNKLCRLLTSPISHITNVAADLLFVLCKESVGRMVKYTGYGNAAGLFARRGLMSRPLEYSSDSEGSDSEEYNKHKEFINPVVGCRTPAHPDPMEGMTDEQKEVLALELVNKVDQLMRDKIIQPCVVGADGRPQPIEHVQQLQMSNGSDHFTNSDEE